VAALLNRRTSRLRPARSTSPPLGHPLIALDWASELDSRAWHRIGLVHPPYASIRRSFPKADRVIYASWSPARELRERMVHTLSPLSCPSSCVQSISGCACLRPPAPLQYEYHGRHRRPQYALPWGFAALRRFRTKAATCTGFASPGYAAPSGFLNLLTLSFRL
jgi:hypothetical protein